MNVQNYIFAAMAAALLAVSGTALADGWHQGEWQGHGHYYHEHGYWNGRYYVTGAAPVYYPGVQPLYYAAPQPVYYQAAPVYYQPAPVYYQQPVLSLRIR